MIEYIIVIVWGIVTLGMWLLRKKLGKGVKHLYLKTLIFNMFLGALCWSIISLLTIPGDMKILILSVFIGAAVGIMVTVSLYSVEELDKIERRS